LSGHFNASAVGDISHMLQTLAMDLKRKVTKDLPLRAALKQASLEAFNARIQSKEGELVSALLRAKEAFFNELGSRVTDATQADDLIRIANTYIEELAKSIKQQL
jgi:hypothetical protein